MGFDYYDFLRSEAIEEAGGLEAFTADPDKYYKIAREHFQDGYCKHCIPNGSSYSGAETGGVINRPLDKRENYIKTNHK